LKRKFNNEIQKIKMSYTNFYKWNSNTIFLI
jgi:hypothetical protein